MPNCHPVRTLPCFSSPLPISSPLPPLFPVSLHLITLFLPHPTPFSRHHTTLLSPPTSPTHPISLGRGPDRGHECLLGRPHVGSQLSGKLRGGTYASYIKHSACILLVACCYCVWLYVGSQLSRELRGGTYSGCCVCIVTGCMWSTLLRAFWWECTA